MPLPTPSVTTNGTGADNLSSNADVVSGQQRGNNGASFANLRSQGSGATLEQPVPGHFRCATTLGHL